MTRNGLPAWALLCLLIDKWFNFTFHVVVFSKKGFYMFIIIANMWWTIVKTWLFRWSSWTRAQCFFSSSLHSSSSLSTRCCTIWFFCFRSTIICSKALCSNIGSNSSCWLRALVPMVRHAKRSTNSWVSKGSCSWKETVQYFLHSHKVIKTMNYMYMMVLLTYWV